jgi:hypothetical protein
MRSLPSWILLLVVIAHGAAAQPPADCATEPSAGPMDSIWPAGPAFPAG